MVIEFLECNYKCGTTFILAFNYKIEQKYKISQCACGDESFSGICISGSVSEMKRTVSNCPSSGFQSSSNSISNSISTSNSSSSSNSSSIANSSSNSTYKSSSKSNSNSSSSPSSSSKSNSSSSSIPSSSSSYKSKPGPTFFTNNKIKFDLTNKIF